MIRQLAGGEYYFDYPQRYNIEQLKWVTESKN